MALIKNPLSGGGGGAGIEIANGVIEEFKASAGTIDANTFVEFVINASSYSANSSNSSTGDIYSAVAISDTTALFNYARNVVLVSFENGTVTTGTAVTLSYGTDFNKLTKLPDGRVVALLLSSKNLYLVTVTVSGNTINVGTYSNVSTNAYTIDSTEKIGGWGHGISTLDSDTVIVTWSDSSSHYIYGQTFTVSADGTITSESSQTSLYSTGASYASTVDTSISSKKVLVGFEYSNTDYGIAYFVQALISGTTITVGSAVNSTLNNTKYGLSVYCLSQTQAVGFMSRERENSPNMSLLRFLLGSENSTSITLGSISFGTAGAAPAPCLIKSDKYCLLLYQYGVSASSLYLAASKVYVADSGDIAISEPVTLTTYNPGNYGGRSIAGAALTDSLFFVAVSGYNYGKKSFINFNVKSAERFIDGLTTESLTTSAAGDVWVLDTGS